MINYDEFKFDPALLEKPRKPGISAYMRLKNEGEFVGLAIRSHLEFYDEIIAVYNGCTDNTEKILLELQEQFPEKIKVYHYLPEVHPLGSDAHRRAPTYSVHSMANYYNYALSKTTFSVAVKLDGDHLAIPQNLAPLIDTIRRDIIAGKQKIYTFSGINLIKKSGSIMAGGHMKYPFSGQGDIMYHPVTKRFIFRQGTTTEKFSRPTPRELEYQYMGIMYFHLKYLKKEFGILSGDLVRIVSFSEFCSKSYHTRLARQLPLRNRLRYMLYRHEMVRKLKYKLHRQHPNLKTMRLIRLAEDLKGIDFQRDVLDKLD